MSYDGLGNTICIPFPYDPLCALYFLSVYLPGWAGFARIVQGWAGLDWHGMA